MSPSQPTGPRRDSGGHAGDERSGGIPQLPADQLLKESESRFRLLAEAIPQLVWTANADGTVDYYNSRVRSYKGFEQLPDGRWNWTAVLHSEDVDATAAAWQTAVRSGTTYAIEHRVCMADGTFRWHLSRAQASRSPNGTVVKWFGTATDIDEQKRAQELLEKKVQERTAQLSDTVAELEHFSYTITHDMRAPLRAMHAYCQILEEEYGPKIEAPGREYMRRITQAAARMDALILDALDFSKAIREELPVSPLDARAIVVGIVESYPHLQPPKATIEIAENFPKVMGNDAGLTQCFSNLLSNAVKFVAPGVHPHVRVWAEEHQNLVRIWVEDNGIGIPPEQHERVFVMFQRLSRNYEGTGIGLALVRKVVHRMQGRVGVHSQPGKGSRFWIELARAR